MNQTVGEAGTVAVRLRGVVYAYAFANLAVAALLLSTVTPAPHGDGAQPAGAQQLASAR